MGLESARKENQRNRYLASKHRRTLREKVLGKRRADEGAATGVKMLPKEKIDHIMDRIADKEMREQTKF